MLRALPFAIACLAATPSVAEPVMLDEVVAVVDARSILLTELEVEARLMRARTSGPASLSAPLAAQELELALERLIDWLVLYAEAERLQVFELPEGDVDRGLEALRAGLGPALDRFLSDFEVDDETLRDIVRRDLRVSKYLEGRFRLAARPRESELAEYFARHEADYRGRKLEQVAGDVRLRLARERFQQLAERFVKDVRRRARVRILRDFDAPGAATPLAGSVSAAGAVR